MRYLKKWQNAGFINEEQVGKITEYMKAEKHRQFLKLIRVLFILGGFWIFIGVIATLRLIKIDMLIAIARILYSIVKPIINLAKILSPAHYRELLSGIGCLFGWGFFHWLGMRLKSRSDKATTELGFLTEKELRLGTSAFTIGYILAASAWAFFNQIIYPANAYEMWGNETIFPVFSLIGMIFFLAIAYLMEDQIAQLFGIGFLGHTIGLFTAYYFACYVIGVQLPVIQTIIGILLLFAGFWHVEKAGHKEDNFYFLFGRTYQWTGLLFIFLALWIMSLWGITYKENYWMPPKVLELWIANFLFIGVSLLAMFYAALNEDRMFFNFGLTFFIIESYTLFFSRVWNTVGTAAGSLLLGVMLITTGYILRYLWLKGKIFKKVSKS